MGWDGMDGGREKEGHQCVPGSPPLIQLLPTSVVDALCVDINMATGLHTLHTYRTY